MPIIRHKPLIMLPTGMIALLPDGDKIAGTSDMDDSVYDPTGVGADAFDRANHHGTQPLSTITGVGDAASKNVGTGPDDVAAGDHVHFCCSGDMFAEIYDPRNLQTDIFNRENHYGTQPLSSIRDAGNSAYLDVGPPEGGVPNTVAPGIHDHGSQYMKVADYDPEGIGGDVFDRSLHTGAIPVTAIEGLGTAALLDVPEPVDPSNPTNPADPSTQLAAADHDHDNEYMRVLVYDTRAREADVFDRGNHIGTQLLETISDAAMTGATATTDGKEGVVPAPVMGQEDYYLRGDGQWGALTDTPGLMLTSIYDVDEDGVVDDSAKLGGVPPKFLLDRANHQGAQHWSTISELGTTFQKLEERGEPNGYPPLDENGKVPLEHLPSSISTGLRFINVWDADANNPAIPPASPLNQGNYYRVSVAGTTDIGGHDDWQVGDWLVSEGTAWTKMDNTDLVNSVNGEIGDVELGVENLMDVTGTASEGQTLVYRSGSWVPELGGFGDMMKNVYDPDGDGVVVDSSQLAGEPATKYLDLSEHFGTIHHTQVAELSDVYMKIEDYEAIAPPTSVDPLSGSTVLSPEAIPPALRSGLVFMGVWTPGSAIDPATTDNAGHYYRVASDGTYDVDGTTEWRANDWIVSEGSKWTRACHNAIVTSLAGKTGEVTLELRDLDDVSIGSATPAGSFLAYDGTNWFASSPSGDMHTSIYDTNEDGIVDNAENLGSHPPSYYLDLANATGTLARTRILGLGTGATANFGGGPGDMAPGDHTHAGYGDLVAANNLSDLTDVDAARTNLGIGPELEFGTNAGQMAEGNHVHTLGDLTDVYLTGSVAGNALSFDGSVWSAVSLPDQAIPDLSDVDTTGMLNGQILAFNSTSGLFLPADLLPIALSDIRDVSYADPPEEKDILVFNGTDWVPQSEAEALDVDVNAVYETGIMSLLHMFKRNNALNYSAVHYEAADGPLPFAVGSSPEVVNTTDDYILVPRFNKKLILNPIGTNYASSHCTLILHLAVPSGTDPEIDILGGLACSYSSDSGASWNPVDTKMHIDYSNDGNFICYAGSEFPSDLSADVQWRVINGVAADITVKQYVIVSGKDNISYYDKEEVRTAPLHLAGHSEDIRSYSSVPGTGIITIDLAYANVHQISVSDPATLAFSGIISGRLTPFTLIIQDGAGRIAFPAGISWVSGGGTAPILKSSGYDIVNIWATDSVLLGTYTQ